MEDRAAGARGPGRAGRRLHLCRRPLTGTLEHPALAPYAAWLAGRGGATIPPLATLGEWARRARLALPDGRPLAFVAPPAGRLSALDYERRVAERGEVVTRECNRHDFMNALAWLAFPRTKAALNAIHAAAGCAAAPHARDRSRDAATLLDESGLLVACDDTALLALWRAHEWRALFWDHRARVAARMRFAVIGHGLLDRLAAPYRALTGKALVLSLDAATLGAPDAAGFAALDAAAAAQLRTCGARWLPGELLPLPLAAVPGWDAECLGERLFDDTAVFRPHPGRRTD